jgi:MFS family permease
MLKKYFAPGSLFSYKGYRNLWISSIFTIIAMSAFPIALAVTVLDAGGSATALGLILAARVLSGVLLSPVGGVWSDRLPRKHVLIAADGFRGLMGTVVVFFDPTTIPLWILGLIVILMGVSDAFGAPASQAIIPGLVPDALLPSANVVRGIAIKAATIAGPGIAGVIVVSLGTHATYIATSIFFAIGAALLFKIDEGPLPETSETPSKFFHDLRDGVGIVWKYKWIAAMIAMASVQLMLVIGVENVMLPVITKREFNTASVFATAAALFSLGGAISAILSIKSKTKVPGLVAVTVWGLFIFAPLVLAFPSSRELIFISYFIAGFSVGPWEAFWSTQVQREVPKEYQGRVFSLDYMGSIGLMPLGMALAGPLANLFGERPLLIGVSIFHLVICAVVLLVPGVKEMKAPSSSIGEQSQA